MFKSDYDQIIRENFDLSDGTTRRYIATLEDAGQEELLSTLSLSMYQSIVSKVDDIDFGTIPMSRGDITKVQGFAGTEECLKIMRALVLEYKQDPSVVDVVLTTIQNVKDAKHLFVKGFAINAELPMLMYNLIVLSIERSTSLMIATCVQFVKDPSSSNPKKALDKVAYQRTMDDMLFKQLVSINSMFKNGSMNKLLEEGMKSIKETVSVGNYDNVVAPIDDDPNAGTANSADIFGNEDPESPDNIDGDPQPSADYSEDNTPTVADNESEEDIAADIRVQPQSEEPIESEVQASTNATDETGSSMEVELTVGDGDTQTTQTQDVDLTDWDKNPNADAGATEENNDSVEGDKIPTVNPGDDISDSDTTLNEDEVNEAVSDVAANIAKKALDWYLAKDKDGKETKKGNKALKIVQNTAKIAAVLLFIFAVGKDLKNGMFYTLRQIVYSFNYTRMKFSDYLDVQADLIEANANELEYSNETGMDEEKKQKVVEKQKKSAAKLRKWANIFNIDKKQTENNAKKAIEEDEKKKKKVAKDEDGDKEVTMNDAVASVEESRNRGPRYKNNYRNRNNGKNFKNNNNKNA